MQHIGCQTPTIAATLKLQKWKTFYGDNDWKVEDVKKVIDGYETQRYLEKVMDWER